METSTETKTIIVASLRPLKQEHVEITPEDTASAILERAQFDPNEYQLLRPMDQDVFELQEQVFPSVADGSKLHVVAESRVG